MLAEPVAERSADWRASQEIVDPPAVLVVIGGQQVEHIVVGVGAQQGEQGLTWLTIVGLGEYIMLTWGFVASGG